MRSGRLVTRLDHYMFRQLSVGLIAATGGLVALIWLTQSLRFIEMMVNRGLSLLVFMRLTGLLIPSFVAVILPITTYVVVQFVYQRLAGLARAADRSEAPGALMVLVVERLGDGKELIVLPLEIVPGAEAAFLVLVDVLG